MWYISLGSTRKRTAWDGPAPGSLGWPLSLGFCRSGSLMDAPAYPELLPVSVKMTHRYAKVSSRVIPCFIILKLLETQTKINIVLLALITMQCFLGSWLVSLWLKLPFPELYSLRPLVHTMGPWPSLDYLSDIPFPPKPSDFVPSVWFPLLQTPLQFLRSKTKPNTWSLGPSWRSCTITKPCRKVYRRAKKNTGSPSLGQPIL